MTTWRANLQLVCDTLLPDGADDRWRGSMAGRIVTLLEAQPALRDDLARLRQLLAALDSPLACAALGGPVRSLAAMTPHQRTTFLRGLMRHRLGALRGGALALKRLAGVVHYAAVDSNATNPTWARLDYPGPLAPSPQVAKPITPVQLGATTTLQCDVVVVGSGAGGGVVAAELAAAGHDVIVLEQGPYLNEADFSQLELDAYSGAYLDGGLRTTQDLGTVILAGACLGGGTVINYTTSLPTPPSVLQEWSSVSGLDVFTGEAFARSMDAVSQHLGVNQQHNLPSARDSVMQRGLQVRGWHVDAMPRNVAGCTQDDVCGYCGLGCVRGAKRSTVKTCLEGAYAHGARIIARAWARRLVLEGGRCRGVEFETAVGPSVVRAKKTVVSAGAIGSPALMLRSGLRGQVGANLRLHPVTAVWGYFDEPVRPWTGTLQARYSDQFADLDRGYGVRFETAPIHPSLIAMAMPWENAAHYDALVARLAHMSVIGVLSRDRSAGRVRLKRDGSPLVEYAPSAYDQRHIRQGALGAAHVLAAAGAREVFVSQQRYAPWYPASQPFDAWTRRVDALGFASNRAQYVSFHQMGTCRMGANRSSSVVDRHGQAHAVGDLYVADASLFPSASGVNPMLTVAALAHYVAQQLKLALRSRDA